MDVSSSLFEGDLINIHYLYISFKNENLLLDFFEFPILIRIYLMNFLKIFFSINFQTVDFDAFSFQIGVAFLAFILDGGNICSCA